jgi:hypothetical protein
MSRKILTDPTVASALTPAQLNGIQKEDKLEPDDLEKIRSAIMVSGSEEAKKAVNESRNAWYWKK